MRASLFSIWISMWVVIFVISITALCYVWYASKERFYFDDRFPEANPRADYWRGGEFFGYSANQMRRIDRTSGFPTFTDIIFCSRIPINSEDFKKKLEQWKSDPSARFKKHDYISEPYKEYWPSWFPSPTPEAYAGDLVDPSGYSITIFRGNNEDCMYLVAY
jgi:hypothetical protein